MGVLISREMDVSLWDCGYWKILEIENENENERGFLAWRMRKKRNKAAKLDWNVGGEDVG